jgi:predicted GTPase
MSRWRAVVLAILFLAPILFLAGLGSYYLWINHWSFYAWWPMALVWIAAYVLAWWWQRRNKLIRAVDFTPPLHWTDRDRQAWEIVQERAKKADDFDANRLTDVQFYVDTAKDLALELARFYHPGAADPIGSLTVPEILAVVELSAHDLAQMVDKYVPGSHLLTVNAWRKARQVTEWYQAASNVYWLTSAVLSPLETGIRYLATQAGMSQPWQQFRQNLLAWFYTAFLQRLGTYLIEVNSGRLRVGAQRYREFLEQAGPVAAPDGSKASAARPEPAADGADKVRQVTLTIFGQVKAGKSSFINALLGEQRAHTDVLPATNEVTRYELQQPGNPTRLVLIDTMGYGHSGPKEDQLKVTEEAAQQSDLLVLLLHARNPARQADLEMLQGLRQWFESRPDLKRPKIVGVMSHIDLLSPAMEWAPPYNWQQPRRPKEHQILQAVNAVHEQLGEFLVGVVPACTAVGKVYGVTDWFLPAMAELLDEAHAVALLRCLKAELDTGKVRRVLQQLLAVGREAVKVLWATGPREPAP